MAGKKKKSLSPQQELFVNNLVEGMSKADAYRNAYDCSKMKAHTIRKRASETFALDYVQDRYNQLMEEVRKRVVWERYKAIDETIWLKDQAKQSIIATGLKQANSNAFLNAIKELNTICDLYPKKNNDDVGTTENQVAEDLLSIMEQVKNSLGDDDDE